VTDTQRHLIVSACLLGLPTRFDGKGHARPAVLGLTSDFVLVPVCPEQLGGLSTPRPPAEIQGGGGDAVLDGRARVTTASGDDVSAHFVTGARVVAEIGTVVGACGAVLKARSPSCGVGETYDGTFSNSLRAGDGVTAALLRRLGLPLWTEETATREHEGAVSTLPRVGEVSSDGAR
jgi:uncharacterized protein YbbK (DUF523 family)